MALIEADDLFKFYHPANAEVRALRGVSLTVERGEVVALIGPSGSGKSTLLACLASLDEPDGGIVTIDGRRVTRRPEAERAALRGSSIDFLAQSGNLFDHLSVAENIKLQMNLSGKFNSSRVVELLSLLGLSDRRHASKIFAGGGGNQSHRRRGLRIHSRRSRRLLIRQSADRCIRNYGASGETAVKSSLRSTCN